MHRLMVIKYCGLLGKAFARKLDDEFQINVCCEPERVMDELARTIPDILVIDILFPRFQGMQVLQVIRASYPDTKVIAITTALDEHTLRRLSQLGVYAIVPKPCTSDHIVTRIRDAAFYMAHPNDFDWCLENEIDRLLMDLGFHMGSNRYACVFEAIRIRYHSIECSMKELYIDVARICGGNYCRVEKAIRDAVADAYSSGDRALWSGCFSASKKREKPYPGNEEFIARAAGYLIAKTRLHKPCAREKTPELL